MLVTLLPTNSSSSKPYTAFPKSTAPLLTISPFKLHYRTSFSFALSFRWKRYALARLKLHHQPQPSIPITLHHNPPIILSAEVTAIIVDAVAVVAVVGDGLINPLILCRTTVFNSTTNPLGAIPRRHSTPSPNDLVHLKPSSAPTLRHSGNRRHQRPIMFFLLHHLITFPEFLYLRHRCLHLGLIRQRLRLGLRFFSLNLPRLRRLAT